jgi:8-oxo-dGTP diphosphatase
LNYEPIGYNLLSDAFTMKDIQSIYETILGKKLDRRNFQRKILSYGILDKKEKHFSGGAHKAPYLYSFNKTKYFEALENGLEKGW